MRVFIWKQSTVFGNSNRLHFITDIATDSAIGFDSSGYTNGDGTLHTFDWNERQSTYSNFKGWL